MEQQKTYDNQGSLFVNDRKRSDRHPDYKGSITIDGKKYWMSGWLRRGAKRDGTGDTDYISISVEPADQPSAESRPAPAFPGAGSILQTAAALSSQAPAPAYAQMPYSQRMPQQYEQAQQEAPKDDLPF